MKSKMLITGGTGTLGHAITIDNYKNDRGYDITIFARSELRLAEMKRRFPYIKTIVGDVRDFNAVQSAVVGHDIVVHAAAMKRIPECESQPRECYLTNIEGSDNVARACLGNVKSVIGISTDKACQAMTMYGASKLATESIFMSYSRLSRDTKYCVVRYGNVVASNGSIIPLWKEQYDEGLPLTITHPDMTRFWMSPFDAVNLIFDSMWTPRCIRVPKIASCKMIDLARSMFPNCKFKEVGLRSNEKLHESLVSPDEPSIEREDCFFVGDGSLGKSYTSKTARNLDMEDFNRMLFEAEEIGK